MEAGYLETDLLQGGPEVWGQLAERVREERNVYLDLAKGVPRLITFMPEPIKEAMRKAVFVRAVLKELGLEAGVQVRREVDRGFEAWRGRGVRFAPGS